MTCLLWDGLMKHHNKLLCNFIILNYFQTNLIMDMLITESELIKLSAITVCIG